MTAATDLQAIRERLPAGVFPVVLDWLQRNRVQVFVSRPRATKLGDYRAPLGARPARITVNGDLNPYAFLVTLVHEFAHHATFERNGIHVAPHGTEWKQAYAGLMRPYLSPAVLPGDVRDILQQHLANATASSCSDPGLVRVLRRYDPSRLPLLEELPERTVFRFNRRVFVKGAVRRSRASCQCLNDRRTYTIDLLAGVHVEPPLRTGPGAP